MMKAHRFTLSTVISCLEMSMYHLPLHIIHCYTFISILCMNLLICNQCVFSWHHYSFLFLNCLWFVFAQWSGVWLQRSSDPAVLQCREPKHPVQSQVLFQGHREVWLCGGTASHTTHSFHVVYVLLLDMHGICMQTVQYKYPYICITCWTKPCALLTYPGLMSHESMQT